MKSGGSYLITAVAFVVDTDGALTRLTQELTKDTRNICIQIRITKLGNKGVMTLVLIEVVVFGHLLIFSTSTRASQIQPIDDRLVSMASPINYPA